MIVNLVDRRIEVYEAPEPNAGQYRAVRFASGDEGVTLRLGEARLEARASELSG